MKILTVFLIIFLLPEISRSQNIPACDSLVIECCSFDVTQNTITLVASNYSSYLFDYPGFILYNSEMDTVAIETVNYFGISTDQPHILDIIHPLELPLDGILELYVLFYDSLTCTFEVTIPDTVTTMVNNDELVLMKVFPNPANDWLFIDLGEHEFLSDLKLRIINSLGQERYSCKIIDPKIQIPLHSIGEPGFYFVQIVDPFGNMSETTKLLLK